MLIMMMNYSTCSFEGTLDFGGRFRPDVQHIKPEFIHILII